MVYYVLQNIVTKSVNFERRKIKDFFVRIEIILEIILKIYNNQLKEII